jgi:cytosine/adenosine deaminase-related metal-dependent hydrolase
MSERIAIEGGVVVAMTGDRKVIGCGYVLVEGDRILEIGKGPAPEIPGLRHIDARGGIVLPGLVDAHAHAGHALTKSLGASSREWMEIAGRIYARATDPDFWRAEAALSALERLRCGTTTAALLMGGGPDVMRTDSIDDAEAHLDAVRGVGIAEVLAVGPNRPSGPRRYQDWTSGVAQDRPVSPRAQLAVSDTLVRRHHESAHGLIRLAVSLPVFSADELADGDPDGPAALSRAAQDLAQSHEVLLVQDGHRDGSIAAAADMVGLGGPRALFAHCIDLTARDIDCLHGSGAAVAHNPSALMSVFGRCPAPELAADGIRVALGSDAPAPDRPFDMFRIMFQAHRYHARHFADDTVLPPWQVLEMATIGGARALGLDREIGSLEPGKRADIIVVDSRRPHLWPPAEPVHRLTRFACGADIATVVVAGRILMLDGKVLSVDENRVLDEARRAYDLMLRRADLTGCFRERVPA